MLVVLKISFCDFICYYISKINKDKKMKLKPLSTTEKFFLDVREILGRFERLNTLFIYGSGAATVGMLLTGKGVILTLLFLAIYIMGGKFAMYMWEVNEITKALKAMSEDEYNKLVAELDEFSESYQGLWRKRLEEGVQLIKHKEGHFDASLLSSMMLK